MSTDPGTPIVWLIDDERADLAFHELIIYSSGAPCELRQFDDPRVALEELASTATPRPHLLVLDLSMPQLSWQGFLARYAELPSSVREGVTLVVLTASFDPAVRDEVERHPLVSGYYYKPLTVDVFCGMLLTLRGRWQVDRASG